MPGKLSRVIGTIKRKPTTAPDRKDDQEAALAPSQKKTSAIHDLIHLDMKDKKVIASGLTGLASGEPMDDKELLLENGVSMLQGLPLNSGLSAATSDAFITMLYHDLPHPPTTIAGPTSRYRRHDGGNNNPWNPEMGKAGTPYSRSVPPSKPKGPNLPDPELVFEQLMKREDGTFRKHPSGLNRLFFSFATIVIHECFQTSREDPWINETSSYVDLSTLYGNTKEEQKRVRTYQQGRIWNDSIASERIMLMPPGVVALLVMFSRNHNSIVESLLTINEAGKYKPWDQLNEEQKVWQDEDLFQLGRNINVGFFASVVLKDYVAAILNTPRADSTWSLDLGKEIKKSGQRVERGTGNVVSTEFAVLYHWHAALSAADAQWMEDVLRANIPELKSVDDMTVQMFYKVMYQEGHKLKNTLPKEWTFNGLKRAPDGRFNDHELAELIKDCIEEPAHAFGAHGTPASLKVVDIMGQLQARELFNVCTMNEFRNYLNLKAYESFEEWNPDKKVARAAELLYGHIDNLELYPGLMAECTKPPMPGSGVCPGQTTGRGILDDAVALVRGDRFLSYDFNSNTLTNWGLSKLGTSVAGGAYGGVLPKLIMNGLPGAWTGTSLYALLQFYTPEAAQGIVKQHKTIDQYDTTRPRSDLDIVSVQTSAGCKQVSEDLTSFRAIQPTATQTIANGNNFMLGSGDPKKAASLQKIFFEDGFEASVKKYFETEVSKLIKDSSLRYSNGKRSFDVVRDITNVTPIAWLAERLAIPLKTVAQPRGLISQPQLFEAYMAIFLYQNFNIIPAHEWNLRAGATKSTALLTEVHSAHLSTQSGFKEHIVDWLAKGSAFEVKPEADRIYKALIATKESNDKLAGECIGVAAPIAGILTHQASLLIDLYLRPGYEAYKARIVELSHQNDDASFKELQGFVFEGMRHAGVVPGLPRQATKDVTIQDGTRGPVHVKKDNIVLIATSKEALDPTSFAEPEKLNPHRPLSEYTLLGSGLSFGASLIGPAIAATLKEVFKLPGIRRATGKPGRFATVEHLVGGIPVKSYLDSNAKESPVPTTLVLEYDESVAPLTNGVNGVNGTPSGGANGVHGLYTAPQTLAGPQNGS
ncbi:Psi-producing oxygenase A [Pseudocercospora fuligena]|uniref:Psi-producing oxygenase A n=1 Tax=Pseudocercospora fuligena TaxID=685502 RepID=A0A8H6VM97_9PEZI|nr:Psi-producing oxygenase A [Pseudocercospora fuligena]